MKSHSDQYDLTQGGVWTTMLKFSIPLFLGTLFQSLYTTVDSVIIGRFAGKTALAAIESVYLFTRIPTNLFLGLASAASILISQHYGAQKPKEVSELSHTALKLSFVSGFIFAVSGYLISPLAVLAVGVPHEIAYEAKWYLSVYFLGLFASMVYNIGSGILRAVGNSRTPFYCLLTSNILNILLDLILVAVFKTGVIGAAVATVISQFISAAFILAALTSTKLSCKISFGKLMIHKTHLVSVFKLGGPLGIQYALYPISNIIIQTRINKIGVNSITAWAICGKLDFLIWAISDTFAAAVSTFVAQNYGAQKFKRAASGVKASLIMALGSTFFVSFILYVWSGELSTFIVDDHSVVLLVVRIMHFIAPIYILYVFCEVLPGAIRGMGDSLHPMIITLLGTCFFRIGWILFVLPFNADIIEILSVYPVSWAITGGVFVLFYFKTALKLKSLKKGKES